MKNLYTGMKKEERKHRKDPMDGVPTHLVAFPLACPSLFKYFPFLCFDAVDGLFSLALFLFFFLPFPTFCYFFFLILFLIQYPFFTRQLSMTCFFCHDDHLLSWSTSNDAHATRTDHAPFANAVARSRKSSTCFLLACSALLNYAHFRPQ